MLPTKQWNCIQSRWRMPSLLVLLLLFCAGSIFYSNNFQNKLFEISGVRIQHLPISNNTELDGFLIKTEGCRIPYMDPFDKVVRKYISKEEPVVCNQNIPPLMDSNLTSIYILNSSLVDYNITNVRALNCCYSSFKRVDSSPNEGDNKVEFDSCVAFNNSVQIDTDFVRVTCEYNNTEIYKDFFAFVPLRTKYKNIPGSSKKFSVLMVGLDAVSRVNLHRQMPKTIQALREIGATEFLGYNKVGDNTFPNLVPVLTGSLESELKEKCWFNTTDKFDKCWFVWNDYSKNNYSTVFGEDSTWMGIFNYVKRGFGKQPTDYYWGPFDSVAEKQIGGQHSMNVFQCIGSREIYKVHLDYIMKYAETMHRNEIPYFGLFWAATISHDFLNKPQLGDDYYAKFFKHFSDIGMLNNTVLIFMSDHGIRWGDIRSTYQGRMEERLPFLFMTLPKAYQLQFHQALINLNKNTRKLTTPFDLHETLKDLLNPYSLTADVLNERVESKRGDRRAYSLFELIPNNRTCESAEIDTHWCTCQMSKPVSLNDSFVIEGSKHVVKYLNSLLEGYRQCANLTVSEISSARVHSSEEQLQGDHYSLDYTLVFKTIPGNANFEATVRRLINKTDEKNNFNVIGTLLPISNNTELDEFLIKTEGCRIPYMDPFDKAVREYIGKEEPVVCYQNIPPLMDSNLTSIYILNNSLVDYNITNVKALNCCYSSFKRVDSSPNEDDNKVEFDSCVAFNNSVQIDTDFVRVTCEYNNTEIYKDFFAFVPLRTKYRNTPGSSKKLSVLMVGLDAVSRVNLHRQMPKTIQTLREIGATEFLGYNKVADNTFPNLVPVLTGLLESELKEKCWFNTTDKFDKCWFVWNDYSKNNYSTVFGEDSTWMGIFNYIKRGFSKQPTDYYWGPFDAVAENEIGGEYRMNVFQCIGSREIYKVLLDYIMKYSETMHRNEIPYFGLFWGSSLSHDFLNKPQLGDDYYAKFFKQLSDTGILNNTVLIFMSDHGIRWDDIRSTYQGRMEERLPFLFMTLPKAYQLQFHQALINLNKNTRKLTTPFDLHETLKDLLNPYSLTADILNERVESKRGDRRAYSLFELIPNNRTCESAEIDTHWCTCQMSKPVSLNDSFVIEGSKHVVKYLNSLLEGYRQCANLIVSEISSAHVHSSEEQLQGDHYSLDYTLVFKTIPGNGSFEATVRRDINKTDEKDNFNVIGTVSRINLYGDQSRCIADFHLKLYCYCNDLMLK
ncbi:hypothetical protein FQA39_LY13708 [Lamprigera yunnana]|nr:hypothetical protein FQA39_LY13708 [Lamprigera yunnana]